MQIFTVIRSLISSDTCIFFVFFVIFCLFVFLQSDRDFSIMTSLYFWKSLLNIRGNSMIIKPYAKFHCDTSTNHKDTWSRKRHRLPPPPPLLKSYTCLKEPSPMRVKKRIMKKIYHLKLANVSSLVKSCLLVPLTQ